MEKKILVIAVIIVIVYFAYKWYKNTQYRGSSVTSGLI